MPLPLFGDPRVPARIWRHLHQDPSGCWSCDYAPDQGGYCRTRMKINGKWHHRMVHRVVYELLIGPIPTETLNHRCLNTTCANPSPQHAGDPMSHADNVRDAKARTLKCPAGHPYDYENTSVREQSMGRGGDRRECKQCVRDRSAAYKAANREKVLAAYKVQNDKRAAAKRAAAVG